MRRSRPKSSPPSYLGNFSAVSGPRGRYDYRYDGAGRMVSDPTRNISEVRYDTQGRPTDTYFTPLSIFPGAKASRLSTYHDGGGRLVSTVFHPEGASTTVHTPAGYKERHYHASGLITTRTNRMATHATVERIQFPGGYFDPQLRPHYYLVDHQGNHVAVVDRRGRDVQRTDYYPYGEPHRRPTSSGLTHDTSENGYLYSGKEYFNIRGMDQYDFAARQYAPTLPRFTTPDPHAESTPSVSPYAYCAGNPVMYTDPTGCDSVFFDQRGNMSRIETMDKDVVSILNYGNAILDSKEFPIHTFPSKKTDIDCEDNITDNYMFDDFRQAMEIFELLSKYSDVEFGLVKYMINGQEKAWIGTSHSFDRNWALSEIVNKLYHQNKFATEIYHSHPSGSPYPSGLKDYGGDIGYSRLIDKSILNVRFFIYPKGHNEFIEYSAKSRIEDFVKWISK